MARSEIRRGVIQELLTKVDSQSYGNYLRKVELTNIRGFSHEKVSFDFPVTALIGPNGGGKTTVLGAAACAYKMVKPQLFFAKSGRFDDDMQNWQIEYELIDKGVKPRDTLRRTASFKNLRWRRGGLDRVVRVFGVSRTVPANERVELRRFAKSGFSVPPANISPLKPKVAERVTRILGRNVSDYTEIRIDLAGRVSLLAGRNQQGRTFSEFHFGAGESSVIRMVSEIESMPDQSLVLIEEIENGLHPVAVVRMVDYLIEVAQRKRIQVIFTTHSNDALEPLPPKGIWALTQNRAFQGKLDINSLRAITGQIEAEVAVFVEDAFSRSWVLAMLRQSRLVELGQVEVHAMAGDSVAVGVNRYHNQDPSSRFPSICFIDGDSQESEDPAGNVYRLPGGAPEAHVFDTVADRFPEIGGKLVVMLLQPFDDHEEVLDHIREVRLTNHDPHLVYSQVGETLGLIPESTVRDAFTNMWAQVFRDEVQSILQPVVDIIHERSS